MTARLASTGVRLVDAEPVDGQRRVHADDPFGNRIELIQPVD